MHRFIAASQQAVLRSAYTPAAGRGSLCRPIGTLPIRTPLHCRPAGAVSLRIARTWAVSRWRTVIRSDARERCEVAVKLYQDIADRTELYGRLRELARIVSIPDVAEVCLYRIGGVICREVACTMRLQVDRHADRQTGESSERFSAPQGADARP